MDVGFLFDFFFKIPLFHLFLVFFFFSKSLLLESWQLWIADQIEFYFLVVIIIIFFSTRVIIMFLKRDGWNGT